MLLLAVANLLFIGCKQIQLSDLHPKGEIANKIPPLKSKIDIESFYRAYAIQYNIESGDFIPFIEIGTQENLLKLDKRIQETEVLFHRDVRRNICLEGEPKGEIVCKIVSSDTRADKKWLLVPNVLTLGLVNLFSVPFFYYKTELEIEFEIFDQKGNLIKRYETYGISKTKVGAYYYSAWLENNNGSKDNDAARQSNMEAVKMALNDLKKQVGEDVNMLNEHLK